MSDLQLRDLTERDFEAALDVRNRSFGILPPADRPWWERAQRQAIETHRAVAVFDGDQLVAHAKARPFQQVWGGRPLPMGGVAGVVVAPEYRRRGVGSLLMRGLTDRMVELGDAVSALYPATMPPYRKLGWELAGAQHRYSFPSAALRLLESVARTPPVPVRRVGPDESAELVELVRRHHARHRSSGPRVYTEADLRRELSEPDVFAYRTEDGLALYEWSGGDLTVSCVFAEREESLRALWSVVGSGSSVAPTVHAYLAPHDALPLLLAEKAGHDVRVERWMFRVLDPAAAVAGRGFPSGLDLDVTLTLEDPVLPDASGTWRLIVADGRGALEQVGGQRSPWDGIRLGPRGFAALYAGTPPAVLRSAGLASGGAPEADAALEAAFAAQPYLLEYF